MYKFVTGFALMITIFWGCKDEMNKTGYDLLLPGDLVSARKYTVKKEDIKSYTVSDEKLRTNKPAFNLLGTFNDPVFGKTIADFACQLRLSKYCDFKNATFDSLKLVLLYNEIYGDKVTPQRLKVYELNSDLNGEDSIKYYQDIDLKSLSKSQVLADISYVPKFKLDSLTNLYGSTKAKPKDTVIQEIAFHIDKSLAQKLMAADSVTRSDNDKFIQYFKGLYIEAGDLNGGGTIMRIKTLAAGSTMKLYYHKDNDTTKYSISYKMNSSSARTSRFYHNYLNTPFAANMDKQDQQDDRIYLQTTGGLSNKIYIPSLNNWSDSTNCTVNKAELVFQVDSILTDTLKFPAPSKIILQAINEKGKVENLSDYTFSSTYFGGLYNSKKKTYSFNIARHMQEIIKSKGKIKNYGFYLSTNNKNAVFSRVVLKGATSDTGIHLDIIYSKVK